jgi:hypothetical protein
MWRKLPSSHGWYRFRELFRRCLFHIMGRSPNYGRNSNTFVFWFLIHITNGLNSLHRKWHTGNQYRVKSTENRISSNLELLPVMNVKKWLKIAVCSSPLNIYHVTYYIIKQSFISSFPNFVVFKGFSPKQGPAPSCRLCTQSGVE